MPELPEVEILVRRLAPDLTGRSIRGVRVFRARSLRPTSPASFRRRLEGARFTGIGRRGKYIVFTLEPHGGGLPFRMLGHLGMTGRMFVREGPRERPRHAVALFDLGESAFVFEDTRYFGRLTFDLAPLHALGPEPFDECFTPAHVQERLRRSSQPVKVRLLDQSFIAGVGNIYASEALFVAGISPRRAARRVTSTEVERLHLAIRDVLREAIALGSTIPLALAADQSRSRLFYYGTGGASDEASDERFRVYGRAGEPCQRCGAEIRRVVQAARSSFYCPGCQQ